MGAPEHVAGTAPLLELRGLQVRFSTRAGQIQPVEGVSLRIDAGETVAVLGESGSGKSVTAQAIMGLLPHPAGRIVGGQILYRGADLADLPLREVRTLCGTEIAMVFQDPLSSLNPVFRVGDQIAEPLQKRRGMGRAEARRIAMELMERVGIPDAARRVNDFPHQFSGGMRQRIVIAIAIALKPAVLIADEPTTALDVTVQAQIMKLLSDLQRETGMAMLLITHDLGVVADVASRAAIMYAGRVVETGPIREVYDHPAHPYTQGLLNSIPSEETLGNRLTPIKGTPPNLLDLPQGCAFAPRCPYATDVCRAVVPTLRTPDGWPPEQRAACFRSEEVLSHGR
ncbi:MAG: ABC transporter ATP-binding protein [Hyphomicrobiales bacterium]|nr:ABC transporter ATP-binding protein [Hyphomicrobiales bacterium]